MVAAAGRLIVPRPGYENENDSHVKSRLFETVQWLMDQDNINDGATNTTQWTPLTAAAFAGNTAIIDILLPKYKGEEHAATKYNAFIMAVQHQRTEAALTLLPTSGIDWTSPNQKRENAKQIARKGDPTIFGVMRSLSSVGDSQLKFFEVLPEEVKLDGRVSATEYATICSGH